MTAFESRDSNKSRNPSDPADRNFVVWDGEGITVDDGSHRYVLFGCYDGTEHHYRTCRKLTTLQCLTLMFEAKRRDPNAFHVAFAFDYDTNMILHDMSHRQFQVLKDTGYVRFYHYRIHHIAGKWLQVTDLRLPKNHPYRTVKIEDAWGFFQASFMRALETYLPDHEHTAEIRAGKAKRSIFTYDDMALVESYWKVESIAFHALMDELRERLYAVDLRISKWHGPGVLANHVYKQQRVDTAKADCGPAVYGASRYAYAGGRFELFRVGNHGHAWGIDINSAYPYAISQLPNLTDGWWNHRVTTPARLSMFGLYRIRYIRPDRMLTTLPSPFFHRDARGNISYPHILEGWYWAPELRAAIIAGIRFDILEAWEYVGSTARPFGFVADIYNQRRELKERGHGSQMALKLTLNSLYGKMAQRAGWERKWAAPTWHQLEWAGWVTSMTRATLFSVLSKIPWNNLVAVETDGIYLTQNPAELGITQSSELGGWDIKEYSELVYLQSGVYARTEIGGETSCKYRGFDTGSLTPSDIVSHASKLVPGNEWPVLSGSSTRFVGYPAALKSTDFVGRHARWETEPRELTIGVQGKRVHSPKMCAACKAGKTAAEMPHDLVISSGSIREPMSARHDIPWLDSPVETNEWREHAEMLGRYWNA